MSRQLIDNWGDYRLAFAQILAQATRSLFVYDEDLTNLHLESPDSQEGLKNLFRHGHRDAVRFALRKTEALRQRHPRTLALLSTYGHLGQAQETPPQLSHLRDSIIITDDRNALIRFERDLPRSKLLLDEPDEVRPYLMRFQEIWNEGGESVTASTLGL